ncbi:MAG: hypothetical protein Q9225_000360 [Loekoesia sp. 1 TL-2023]
MDGPSRSRSRRFQDHVFVWDKKFAVRQLKTHNHENNRLTPDGGETIVEAFLNQFSSRLDPPQYNYMALRRFLEKASEDDLRTNTTSTQYDQKNVLLDDRRDDTGWRDVNKIRHFARDWNSYAEGYPPEGENILQTPMNAKELYSKRLKSMLETGAERRVIYVSNMSSACALALVSTTPRYQAPVLRDFMQRYIFHRVFLGVSMLPNHLGFTLEFHLPYYALRQHDVKIQDQRRLRRCGRFVSSRLPLNSPEYLYEAQISVVIVGLDEWVWTAYCCTETYFGSEETIEFYHERGLDAPLGGARPTHYPIWNPREYFLLVFTSRMNQITKEWSNLVIALEERFQYQEESIFSEDTSVASLVDDGPFQRTKEYTTITDLLRLLHNALVKFIDSWENFEKGEIQYFEMEDYQALGETWDSNLANINRDVSELRYLRRSLLQRIEMFDIKRSGVSDSKHWF